MFVRSSSYNGSSYLFGGTPAFCPRQRSPLAACYFRHFLGKAFALDALIPAIACVSRSSSTNMRGFPEQYYLHAPLIVDASAKRLGYLVGWYN